MSQDALAPIGVIAHYNLLEVLDASGVGELFRARDTRQGRTVVVRVLPSEWSPDDSRFIERVRAARVLSHPNAITVFDVGIHDGRVYIVFEFLKGRSLRSEMSGRAVNVRRAVEMAVQIADAVAEAHAAGIMHRGLSPDSIVVTAKGNAKIPAHDLAVQGGLERVAGHVRLPDYDSPEEAKGQPADERSDVYSVGAILYEMLTMRRPMHRGASAPGASNPQVGKALDAVVLRAVAPNPSSRYQSVVELAFALRSEAAALAADDAAAKSEPASGPSASMGGVLLVTTVLAILAAILWWITRA